MPSPPRILFPQTVVMITSRVQQGLPFVHTPLMEMILWSALAVAQGLYPVKIIAFMMMGNHIHMILLVEDPQLVESFVERFKCETAHAVNRLLGRRQVTVWCEGYDSPTILTVDDLIEKIAYVYANPVRAKRVATIGDYKGISSWRMFNSGETNKKTKRIRRPQIEPLPKGSLTMSQQRQIAALVEQQINEEVEFNLTPNAWMVAFPSAMSAEELTQRVHNRINEIETEMAEKRKANQTKLPNHKDPAYHRMDIPYFPQTFGRRMWCICRDIPLRIAFIQFIKYLRKQAREIRNKWLSGDLSAKFPEGLFPPAQPILATILPAFVRSCIVPA